MWCLFLDALPVQNYRFILGNSESVSANFEMKDRENCDHDPCWDHTLTIIVTLTCNIDGDGTVDSVGDALILMSLDGNIVHLYEHSTHKMDAQGPEQVLWKDKDILWAQANAPNMQQSWQSIWFPKGFYQVGTQNGEIFRKPFLFVLLREPA